MTKESFWEALIAALCALECVALYGLLALWVASP